MPLFFLKRKKITSFSKLELTLTGMRHHTEYEALALDDGVVLSEYAGLRSRGGEERRPKRSVTVKTDRFIDLLNKCGVLAWDGFYGKHPRGVLDGTMFSLSALVNGDQEIFAHSSQNFPPRFRDFTDALRELLQGADTAAE